LKYQFAQILRNQSRRLRESRTTMKAPRKRLPVAEQIRKGLEEAILHAKGEITLKTTTLEMPDRPPQVGAEELAELRLESGSPRPVGPARDRGSVGPTRDAERREAYRGHSSNEPILIPNRRPQQGDE
jgi:hypothetical protein